MDKLERLSYFENLLMKDDFLKNKEVKEILSEQRMFSKIEDDYVRKYKDKLITKKIGILSPYSIEHFKNVLKIYLLNKSIYPEFYIGTFNNTEYEIFNNNSGLYKFNPNILIIFTDYREILEYPELFASENSINEWVDERINTWRTAWHKLKDANITNVFQSLYVVPSERSLGNLESNCIFSMSYCLRLLNQMLIKEKPPQITLFDMDYYASVFGKGRWYDDKNYFISKQGFSFDAIPYVASNITKLIEATIGKTKKCLVLDLDNTLWGGVIGDDGLNGINLDPNNPIGEAYINFQKYLKKLKDRGVMLAVCSKNEETIAKLPFQNHANMILKLSDICCFIANWNDKVGNIKNIAKNLNIGLDSIVFFDDNPMERALVERFLPEVAVVLVEDDSVNYLRNLDSGGYFDWLQITKEDIERTKTYSANSKREEKLKECVDYDSFLMSLEMIARIGVPKEEELSRFVQLINKTNQFNIRTKRYSELDVEKMYKDKSKYLLLCAELKDKFSNYGIIACAIIRRIEQYAFIDTWVMSCRVFNKGLEFAFYNKMVEYIKNWYGIRGIFGEFIETNKNGFMVNFYPSLGFEIIEEIEKPLKELITEGKVYYTSVEGIKEKLNYINIDAKILEAGA